MLSLHDGAVDDTEWWIMGLQAFLSRASAARQQFRYLDLCLPPARVARSGPGQKSREAIFSGGQLGARGLMVKVSTMWLATSRELRKYHNS